MRLKEQVPGRRAAEDGVGDGQALLELLGHHGAGAVGDVKSGVLLRVGRRDDGHQVKPVRHVHLERQTEVGGVTPPGRTESAR